MLQEAWTPGHTQLCRVSPGSLQWPCQGCLSTHSSQPVEPHRPTGCSPGGLGGALPSQGQMSPLTRTYLPVWGGLWAWPRWSLRARLL